MTAGDGPTNTKTSVLVLGAYGLIGSGVCKHLIADGLTVIGLGRDAQTGKRVLPGLQWIERDISTMTQGQDWDPLLRDVDIVVNCSGALQAGPADDLENLHHTAIAALASACAQRDAHIIQISALGALPDATTEFLASKARGDAAIQASGARYHIFRPGLVLAPNAYGGSMMLRMLAAVPFVQLIALPNAQIQTIALEDLTRAVSAAVSHQIPVGFEGDLAEATPHSLAEVVRAVRHWLGFRPARHCFVLPEIAIRATAKLADRVAHLGWRSPLRSTSIKVLEDGIRGTPVDLAQFGLPQVASLPKTLARMPVGAQDRLFARMALLTPIILLGMCVFWLASGIIGLISVNEAAHVLETVGWPQSLAIASVVFWSCVDIAIAAGFAIRRYATLACWSAVGVSVFYLLASTFTVPGLWLDPLGPLVKIIPAILLALVARIALDAR